MTENNRNDDGTYAPATPAEPTFGQAGVEADMGFKSMPDPLRDDDPIESDVVTEAARLALFRDGGIEPVDETLQYLTADGTPVDPKETISLEKASADLTAYHGAQDANRAQSIGTAFAEAIDEMRKEAVNGDPALASHYGLDPAEVLAKADATEKPAKTTAAEEVSVDGLDPEVSRALQHPQVRQAIEAELTHANQVREQYSNALNQANTFARAAFMEVVPELAGLPEAQIEAGLHLLSQQNPARFNQAMATLQRVSQIQAAQEQQRQYQAYAQQQQFQEFAKAEDKKFHQMVDAETLKAIGPELAPYFAELGVSNDELIGLWQSQPWIRSAAGQKIVADAVRFRLSQKQSTEWKAKAAPKALPPVQKPGTRSSSVRADDNASNIRSLERQLDSSSGNKALLVAAKLQAAKRAASNR